MISIVLAMVAIMALAAGVVVYVAFPHRGVQVPHAPWIGESMDRVADRVPTLHSEGHRHRG